MALIRWEPRKELESFRDLRDEVDRLFDEFYQVWSRPWSGGTPSSFRPAGTPVPKDAFIPTISLKETDDDYVVTAEIPGLTAEELDISLSEDSITLKGERREEGEVKKGDYHYRETSYGSFHRMIPLPGQIRPEDAKAKLKDGVLTLTLPKAAPGKRRVVTVSVK